MTIRHPVPEEILLDVAAGAASPGKTLLVATHLSMCGESRVAFGLVEAVGGVLLDGLAPAPLELATAEGVLGSAADADERAPEPAPEAVRLCGTVLPEPLATAARGARDRHAWRTLGRGIEAALLPDSTPGGRTQLLFAKPGVRILPHTHEGEELVLVLRGAFWDEGERFGPGDVAVIEDLRPHAPRIDPAEPCLCLAVNAGPIRFTGPAGWMLNRVNRF